MTKVYITGLILSLFLCGSVSMNAAEKQDGHIAHIVYFSLKEKTAEARQKLVDACDKYLTGHEGTVYYGTGIIAEDLNRPVNDREFDVGLHIVFESKDAHDEYQESKRHLQFIEENKDTWQKVRVFDTRIKPKSKKKGDD